MTLPAYIVTPTAPASNVADTTVSNTWGGVQTLIAVFKAGTAAAGTAPFKLTTGTSLTAAEAGAMEYTTPDLFFTPGSAIRYNIPLATGAAVQGDINYASAASIYSRLAKDTNATRYLSNTGSSNNPAWAQVDLSNGITGILPVANGGTGSSTAAAARTALGVPLALFDHYADIGNIGTGEDDLYSDTIAAGQLSANGQKIFAEYAGSFVSSATATRQIRIYFAGTLIFDTGTLTLSLSSAWTCYVKIIRVSATVVRYDVSFTTEGAALAAYTAVGELTGLTLSGTNILKITGEAAGVGAATNDIIAKTGCVYWMTAA